MQFNKDFGFKAAAEIAPYLARLGVSHIYASPYLKARPGSTHGYDIVDHHALNPELGSTEDYAAMIAAFRDNGLSQILDFVPNHMGVGGADNPLWLDVLEWGPESSYAGWFDIDWSPDRRYLRNKLLVPFLGDQYGEVLNRAAHPQRSTLMREVSQFGPMRRTSCRSVLSTTTAYLATPTRNWSSSAMPFPACWNGATRFRVVRSSSRRNLRSCPRTRPYR